METPRKRKPTKQRPPKPQTKSNAKGLKWDRRNTYARRITRTMELWQDGDIFQEEMEQRLLQALDDIKAERLGN